MMEVNPHRRTGEVRRVTSTTTWMALAAAWALLTLLPAKSYAHCDGMDGPVVAAARKALETRNVDPVLIWVRSADEGEIRKAFEKTLAVRRLGPESRELADSYFFETLVRLHRAGEGEPYTGLKPAGRDLGPAIPAADKALAIGSADGVVELVTHAVHEAVGGRFAAAMSKKGFQPDDIQAGREYVEAYVNFLHTVERLYETAQASASSHASHSAAAHAEAH
jgi:hypothetical protein